MSERELLQLIANQVNRLTKDVEEIRSTMATKNEMEEIRSTMATKNEMEEIRSTMATKSDLEEISSTMTKEMDEIKSTMATKEELAEIKAIVIRCENDHGQKLGALLDGYKQHSEILIQHTVRLERIEEKIDVHDIRIHVIEKTINSKR